jgi:WhiB family redox-sensing transcriptional regulator
MTDIVDSGWVAYREDDPSWREEALCSQVDPDLWFPKRGGASHEAKKVCADCPVARQCLDYAIKAGEIYGIWGGLGHAKRVKLAKTR